MSITYIVAVDFNDDGDYADLGEAITADVLDMTWRLGMARAFESVAAPSTAQITVQNRARDYSPETTGDDLVPGHRLRIQSDDGATVRTHFTGIISHIEPLPGDQGKRTAVIHVVGPERDLSENRVTLPLQANVTADTVIDAVLDAALLRRPVLDGYMIVGVDGHNTVGTHKLFGQNIARSLETGKSILAYAGDTWGDGIPADRAIWELAESERGRFFFDRSGQAVFYNRHHTLLDVTPDATFDDDMDGLDYVYGVDVVNQVQVTVMPRSVGAADSALWTLGSNQKLTPGVRHIIARFRDDNGNAIGALNVIPPRRYTDYTALDDSGADASKVVNMGLVSADGGGARLVIDHTGSADVYLQAGTQVRGTPLIQTDPVTLAHQDMTSVTVYGLRMLTVAFPALTSLDEAEQMARYELARRKDPRGWVQTLRLSTRSHPADVLARTLFDRITIQETQTGHTGDYFIVAEAHTVNRGGTRHDVTWLLEPADSDVYFIIGTHNPDGTRMLAY
jgi:hypothetical protein